LIEAVGSGGMAAVLKARDTELGRIVALKILPPEAARDPESINRFKQEARAAARLDHDNVARVYFCGEDQGLHFIAFEFVEGINLRQMIDRRGPLTVGECLPYMMQVAAGLNHAAERGVVHRDIKPSNILITPDGRAKIVDMGLARHLGSESVNGGVTQSGVTLGTFDYISPEQALDPRRADVRSDIYSLGCTFYHALTGRPPVPEGTAAKKLRAHQDDAPLDPRELNPAIPDEMAAILARMMAKDPARRYQTPTELISHLKGLAERLKLRTDPLAHDTATKSVPAELHLLPEAPRVRPVWLLAAAAVALAVVAFVVATSGPGPAPGLPGNDQSKKPPDPFVGPGGPPNGPPHAAPAGPVTTVAELVQRLEDAHPAGKVQVQFAPGTFDLWKLDHAVAFRGKELELVGAPGGLTKVILAAAPEGEAHGTLTVKADKIAVRNVWFDLKLDPDVTDDLGPGVALAGLRLDEAGVVTLTDCVFAATDPKLQSHAPRSVRVTRPAGACQIQALRCLFAPGAVGVLAPAGAQVALADCGFAPHAAAVMIDPAAEGASRAEVRLDRSSFMLDRGECAVEAGAPGGVRVTASDCLFAPVGGAACAGGATSEANRRGVVSAFAARSSMASNSPSRSGAPTPTTRSIRSARRQETFTFDECKARAPEVAVAATGRADLKESGPGRNRSRKRPSPRKPTRGRRST
jgi:serine/threonine protein kinase